MKIGIIGLAQSGKKTLFKLLTGIDTSTMQIKGEFPVGSGVVPDERVDALTKLYKPKKTKNAEIEWVLFPGLGVDEKSRRNWFDQARELDGLCYVIRQFEDESVYHEEGSVDMARDLATLDLELACADLAVIETRLERLEKENVKKTAAEREKQKVILGKMKDQIENELPLRALELEPSEIERLGGLKFISRLRSMVVINVGEATVGDSEVSQKLVDSLSELEGRECITLSAQIEADLAEIEDADERAEFLADLGLSTSGAARMAQAALRTLSLISFLTVGHDEVRAWCVRSGSSAPIAAGAIHSDLERGFIRAEVMRPDELLKEGSETKLKEQGKVALKGKDYIVQEGDILHILAN